MDDPDDFDRPDEDEDSGPSSHRCTACAINWPPTEDYDKCPQCGESTWPTSNAVPLPVDEAWSLKTHAEFERYYEETRPEAARMDALDRQLS